jgi:pSer/pThr/pTyr-binding forkhead associated (FHA) protein
MICILEIVAGPALGERFRVRQDQQLQIGRHSTADVSIPSDLKMSRHHLILEGSSECFRVRDIGSANGTYVNQSRVSNVELCAGDNIQAGSTVLSVSILDEADEH